MDGLHPPNLDPRAGRPSKGEGGEGDARDRKQVSEPPRRGGDALQRRCPFQGLGGGQAPRRRRPPERREGRAAWARDRAGARGEGLFLRRSKAGGRGDRYSYRLDDDAQLYPDPASRFQPDGPHGESEVIDASSYPWTDRGWRGVRRQGQVIYELHFGTFTQEGTYRAAAAQLPELARLGVTVIETMPVAEFAGRFGWGYDGVALFAPSHIYGSPDDLRYFVDCAHAAGLGVILDVVYNHFGPSGGYHAKFSPDYFTKRYKNEWGETVNFDGDNAGPVREFFTANARCWIEEFHLDGLRLDATQSIFDASERHILADITRAIRAAAGQRSTYIVAENEPQEARLVRPPAQGGYGIDALWNDDFHHSATVAVTGHNEAYYSDYLGRPQELVSTAKWGFLYQGQWYPWQKKGRGAPAFDLPPAAYVNFLQNHDQVANSARGERIHQLTSPGRYRSMTALLLLLPATPMLFQGQEFAASSPFLYFADHEGELARLVQKGRREFLGQFSTMAAPGCRSSLAAPHDPTTFARCKLDFSERSTHQEAYLLHQDLLRLRRDDPTFSSQRPHSVDGAVLSEQAFLLRYFADAGADRLLIVNLGPDLHLEHVPEPLVAPPDGGAWRLIWSSEDPRYGGRGMPAVDFTEDWLVPGEATIVAATGA